MEISPSEIIAWLQKVDGLIIISAALLTILAIWIQKKRQEKKLPVVSNNPLTRELISQCPDCKGTGLHYSKICDHRWQVLKLKNQTKQQELTP